MTPFKRSSGISIFKNSFPYGNDRFIYTPIKTKVDDVAAVTGVPDIRVAPAAAVEPVVPAPSDKRLAPVVLAVQRVVPVRPRERIDVEGLALPHRAVRKLYASHHAAAGTAPLPHRDPLARRLHDKDHVFSGRLHPFRQSLPRFGDGGAFPSHRKSDSEDDGNAKPAYYIRNQHNRIIF